VLHQIGTGLQLDAQIIDAVSYVEIHFHLLPGIDDGPDSIEESLALAVAAVADGTRTVVATPHVRAGHVTDPGQLPARVRELAERLQHERIRLDVLPGGELAHGMVGRLAQRQLETIAQGPPGRRWVLLEASFSGLDSGFTSAADELRERGFAVVVAHPERARQTPATAAALKHELAAGSGLQLTASSLAGLFGDSARNSALHLMKATNRVAIASDAHGGARMPALRLAVDGLTAAGERDPGRLVTASPRRLLEHGLQLSLPDRHRRADIAG
jgi:protein-tyrosine phosphatase